MKTGYLGSIQYSDNGFRSSWLNSSCDFIGILLKKKTYKNVKKVTKHVNTII